MSRIRIKIGKMVLRNSDMSPAEGAMLGPMVETHLARLIAASGAPAARNAGVISVNTPLNSGKGMASSETAMAIARGIHQSLKGKR